MTLWPTLLVKIGLFWNKGVPDGMVPLHGRDGCLHLNWTCGNGLAPLMSGLESSAPLKKRLHFDQSMLCVRISG